MNVKDYISSGIVESYVLGLAAQSERDEFEAMCVSHSEVLKARTSFELALEHQLVNDSRVPPVHLKQQIEERLAALSAPEEINEPVMERVPVRSMTSWKWIAAASLILLAGAAYWAFSLNDKYQQLFNRNIELEAQLQRSTARLDAMQNDTRMLESPTVKMASLQSMPLAPGASAKIFWDTTSKDVYLMIHNLPEPATDKQYQLWALINNQPVDLGVFELRQKSLMVKMKNAQEAQAFAITLEPKGGSSVPTGGMYLMGKL